MTSSVIHIAFYSLIQLIILQSVLLNLEMLLNMPHNSKRWIYVRVEGAEYRLDKICVGQRSFTWKYILLKFVFSSTVSWLVFQLIVSPITRVGSKILKLTTVWKVITVILCYCVMPLRNCILLHKCIILAYYYYMCFYKCWAITDSLLRNAVLLRNVVLAT